MLLLFLSDYRVQQQCISKFRELNFVSDYGVQRRQVTEIVFYRKVLENDILVGLERILDYAGNCNLVCGGRVAIIPVHTEISIP